LDPPLCRANALFGKQINASAKTQAKSDFEKTGLVIAVPPLDRADLGGGRHGL
jgi:hypothetical protein